MAKPQREKSRGKASRVTSISSIRRDELTAAALRCIASKGYDRVTLDDVAKEAGSSQGNVLYHFKNREALMVATAERIRDKMLEVTRAIWAISAGIEDEEEIYELISERCSDPNIDFISVTRYGVKLLIRWFEEDPQLIAVGLELFCQIQRNPVMAEVRDKVYPYIRNVSAAFIDQGMKRGLYSKRNPKQAANMLLTLLAGFSFAHVTTRKEEFNAREMEQELCDLIFGYLQRPQ